MAITYESLMSTIAQVAQAERITKEGLRTLSRDILAYVVENEDIRPVNALLGQGEDGKFVLTPMNWRVAVQYFHEFVAFTSNFDDVKEFAIKGKGQRQPLIFHKKSKKRWEQCAERIRTWLEDENNDIWVWSNSVKVEAPPVDYSKKIQQAINAAMDEGKGNMSVRDVVAAIIGIEDVSIHDMMAAMESLSLPTAEPVEEAA